jgi:hypothetical protein
LGNLDKAIEAFDMSLQEHRTPEIQEELENVKPLMDVQ